MAKANASAEPSMEEILASIRRIISDDTPAPPAPAPAAKPAPVAVAPAAAKPPEPKAAPAETHVSEDDLDRLFAKSGDDSADETDDVMDLGEAAVVADDEPLDLVEGLLPDEADVQFVDKQPEEPAADEWGLVDDEPEPAPPPPPPRPAAKAPPPPPRPEPAPMVEPEDEEPLVSPRTGATVNAAFGQLTHTILAQNAKTLDDLVKEMLRPMLKAWLDENLPTVVERLVRAEIERVSRGR